MSEPAAEIPVHQEDYTSAAIDGARISCVTASILVEMDARLSDVQRDVLSNALDQARRILDVARLTMLPAQITSLHVIGQEPSGIILPP